MDTRTSGIIETALRKGARAHAFMSGGGLRVFRLERDDRLVGYGEAIEAEEALRHLAEDFVAGGRPYEEVYGKLRVHYLTGQSEPSSPVDAWLRQGHTLDAWAEGDAYVVELRGLREVQTAPEVVAGALRGETVRWESRGYTYETTRGRFPNGEPSASTSVIAAPPGKRDGADPWMYTAAQTGRASTLSAAIGEALCAAPVEIERRAA